MKSKLFNIAAFACGLGLLAYIVHLTGPEKLWSHVTALGGAFLWIILIYQVEAMAEVKAWSLAVRPSDRTGYFNMYAAAVAGSTLNALLPGGQAGEVLKGNLLRDLVPPQQIVSSLVLYNFLFMATSLPVLAVCAVLCLASGDVALEVGLSLLGGVAVSTLLPWLIFLWIRRGMIGDVLRFAQKIPLVGRKVNESLVEEGRRVDVEVQSFRKRRPRDFAAACALLVCARVLAVVEVWAIMLLLGFPVSPGLAAGLYAAGQLLYYMALFLPTRLGVLEGGSVLIFNLFSMSSSLGLAMEFVRRMRKITFTLIGVALLGWLGVFRSLVARNRSAGET